MFGIQIPTEKYFYWIGSRSGQSISLFSFWIPLSHCAWSAKLVTVLFVTTCLSVCPLVWLFVWIYCLSLVCLFESVCLSCLSVCCQFLTLFVCLCVCLFIWLLVCQFVYLFFCFSTLYLRIYCVFVCIYCQSNQLSLKTLHLLFVRFFVSVCLSMYLSFVVCLLQFPSVVCCSCSCFLGNFVYVLW